MNDSVVVESVRLACWSLRPDESIAYMISVVRRSAIQLWAVNMKLGFLVNVKSVMRFTGKDVKEGPGDTALSPFSTI